jgi:hypothetical protein
MERVNGKKRYSNSEFGLFGSYQQILQLLSSLLNVGVLERRSRGVAAHMNESAEFRLICERRDVVIKKLLQCVGGRIVN